MDKYKSKLIFNKYIVKKVLFEYNENFKEKPIDIEFKINKNTSYDKEKMMVDLETEIFEKNDKYPFHMVVVVRGIFSIENNDEGINFEPNAIAILYPYIRAIVSTYTSQANIMPLILPIINVNKLLEDKREN